MPISFAGSADDLEFGTRVCRKINEGYADLIAKHPRAPIVRVRSGPPAAAPPESPTPSGPWAGLLRNRALRG